MIFLCAYKRNSFTIRFWLNSWAIVRAAIERACVFRLPCAYSRNHFSTAQIYIVDLIGGERGTRTLDPGIMSAVL